MFGRNYSGWVLGVLLALALGAALAPAVSAAKSKAKVVRHTGIVKIVAPDHISLVERRFLRHHVHTYMLSSPTVHLAKGAPGSMDDVKVGSKVTLTGTLGADKKVTVTQIQVVAAPMGKKMKK
jgi:hypothetical protein